MIIEPYAPRHRDAVLELSIRAWEPVFPLLETSMPTFVFENFYPSGWRTRQYHDIAQVLDNEPASVTVATEEGRVVGWIAVRLHPTDSMGEVYVLAVDPSRQRRGIGAALLEQAFSTIRDAGMDMVMVETGSDPGHAPSRAIYEAAGFQIWPVARYFKDLTD